MKDACHPIIWHRAGHTNYLDLIANQKATKTKSKVTLLNLLPKKKNSRRTSKVVQQAKVLVTKMAATLPNDLS